jgi:hypothetical protein
MAYCAGNSAERNKTDILVCEFWGPVVYLEMRDLLD